MEKEAWKFVELLMKYGADPTIKDNKGKTALHYNHWITWLKIIIKDYSSREEESRGGNDNLLDIPDQNGNTPLNQAIIDLSQGNAKLNLVKEIIKLNADFWIQNDEGENALFISAKLGNSDIFGMLIMKMLNDELDNKLIGRLKMKSSDVFKMVNNINEDLLMTAIKSKSKDCISTLTEIANFSIAKEHVIQAKELLHDNSKLYTYIKKKFQAQDGTSFLYFRKSWKP